MEIKTFTKLPEDAVLIRDAVFVNEQGFRDEYDDEDNIAVHAVIYDGEKPVGTFRYFRPERDNKDLFLIGRIAILKEYRGSGLGLYLMDEAKKCVEAEGAKEIIIYAQCQASGFYEKAGYSKVGTEYIEGGKPHIKMNMKIK